MNVVDQPAGIIHFGVFEVDLRSAELRKQGMRIRLPGQSFQVLQTLLSRPGELVTREELQQKLWPKDSFGDFEHGLNAAVNRVREALGDSAENPRFVETLPRRGYRFVAPVERLTGNGNHLAGAIPANGHSPSALTPSAIGSADTEPTRDQKKWLPTLVIIALVLCVAGLLYARYGRHFGKGADQDDLRPVPLTALPGFEATPTFSPDGSQVAFSWDGGNIGSNTGIPHSFDIYVKVVGTEHVERLTNKSSIFVAPSWSPDGRTIAFMRYAPGNSGIFIIPARGGPERKLADIPQLEKMSFSLSWSPDGRHLAYSSGGDVHILTVETGADAKLSLACKEANSPAYSPDGAVIAFACNRDDDVGEIYTVPAAGGPAKYLGKFNVIMSAMAWTTDAKRLVLASEGDLWELNRDGGKPRHLLFAQGAEQPAISPRGDRLAFVKGEFKVSIWKVDLDPDAHLARTVIAPSTREQRAPDISPDGKKITFEAERSGSHEVWVANLDGSDAVQLTHFHRLTGTPRWSPDGRQIVFDSRETGQAALYLVDPETATPRRIPISGLPQSVPTWSRDGKWIYFRAGRGTAGGLYKVSPQGGDPTLVSPTPGYYVQESSDGRTLYFTTDLFGGEIHARDARTGQERPLAGMPKIGGATEWTVTPTGIYFIELEINPPSPYISFYEFASTKVTRRIPLEKFPMGWGGLAISPDGKALFYSQVDQASTDLMLVEGFR